MEQRRKKISRRRELERKTASSCFSNLFVGRGGGAKLVSLRQVRKRREGLFVMKMEESLGGFYQGDEVGLEREVW